MMPPDGDRRRGDRRRPSWPPIPLLDYAAFHAPPVPDWFVYHEPDRPVPPQGHSVLNEKERHLFHRVVAGDLQDDQLDKLAPEEIEGVDLDLVKTAVEVERKHLVELDRWAQRENINREAHWAYQYAQALMRVREGLAHPTT